MRSWLLVIGLACDGAGFAQQISGELKAGGSGSVFVFHLQDRSIQMLKGGQKQSLGEPPKDKTKDWAVLVRRTENITRTYR